jgi:hypothetical protein
MLSSWTTRVSREGFEGGEGCEGQKWITRQRGAEPGYVVYEAIDALSKRDPVAAQWWKENAPHILGRLWLPSFPADVCRIVDHVVA